ncbi:MAG: imidazolonepropionase [Armatimonadota bacterium]|nr:imidazolonepropionase [Armatimonadota bacterium]
MPDYIIGPIAELHTLHGGAGLRRGQALRDTGIVRDAGIAVVDGLVAAVGSSADVLKRFDLPSRLARLVTPGLVDPHTHIVWGGNRADEFLRRSAGESYESIAAAGGGILSTMRATREASVEELTDGIVHRADAMLRKGTTTIEVKASYGLSPDGCEKELNAILAARNQSRARLVATFMGAHAFPPDYLRSDYVSLLCSELIPHAARHGSKPTFCDVFCEVGAFSVEESAAILDAAIASGLRPKIHADEFNELGGVAMAVEKGAASCDHLLVTGGVGRSALATADTAAVLLPGTALYLGKPYADARAMAEAGCAIALGTDFNPGSSMVCSMAFAMGLAVTKMKLSTEEALTAATVNAAAAIDAPAAGRIEAGLPADLCLWPCDSLAEMLWQFTYIEPEAVFVGGSALE